jgi:hypothetical protein
MIASLLAAGFLEYPAGPNWIEDSASASGSQL